MSDFGSPAQITTVKALDPLGADEACAQLPGRNATADVRGLVAALRGLLPGSAATALFSADECIAAMRDLGMFLGSLKRHGVEPLHAVPEATPVLLELGRRTDMIPRDTVHHYTTWNPTGPRRRRYTAAPEEEALQDSVRMVLPRLREGLEICGSLDSLDLSHPLFAPFTDRLTEHVGSMVDSIDLVISKVSPVFFAQELRPYFEDIEVAGMRYLGPAAAQVPLWLIDQAVWASDRGETSYTEFIRDSLPYGLPRWRRYYEHRRDRPSLVTRLADALDTPLQEDVQPAAEAVARLLRVIVVFRGRHFGVARQAYAEEVRLYPMGSGGAGVDLLRQILDLTRENSFLVRPSKRAVSVHRTAEVTS